MEAIGTTMAHEEYLRRNLIHCSAIGARAGVQAAIKRLSAMKRTPKWLLHELAEVLKRAEKLPPELAAWRIQADDAPDHMRG